MQKMPKREKIAGLWSNWDLEQTPLRHRENYEIYRQRQSKRDEERMRLRDRHIRFHLTIAGENNSNRGWPSII